MQGRRSCRSTRCKSPCSASAARPPLSATSKPGTRQIQRACNDWRCTRLLACVQTAPSTWLPGREGCVRSYIVRCQLSPNGCAPTRFFFLIAICRGSLHRKIVCHVLWIGRCSRANRRENRRRSSLWAAVLVLPILSCQPALLPARVDRRRAQTTQAFATIRKQWQPWLFCPFRHETAAGFGSPGAFSCSIRLPSEIYSGLELPLRIAVAACRCGSVSPLAGTLKAKQLKLGLSDVFLNYGLRQGIGSGNTSCLATIRGHVNSFD